ncbi:hypothetical protein EUTSA_v10000722mg, partial [Eutrema salsugineum]
WFLRSRNKRISQSQLAKRADPFFLPNLLDGFEESKYGWLANDIKRLCELKRKVLNGSRRQKKKSDRILINDSDDVLPQESITSENCSGTVAGPQGYSEEDSSRISTDYDNGTHPYEVGEEEDELWRLMAFAQESSKVTVENSQGNDSLKQIEDCEHSFIHKDDIGEVCRVCGLIKTPIESIIEVVYNKPKRSRRTYMREQEKGETRWAFAENRSSQANILGDKMFIHPRHDNEMRPHQIEGFNFLCNNLAADEPGGCILAHAPGSGKTFLLISFMQSFMAMDPQAKPLIVLPKGIIESWKREFTKWAVENIPLIDFYSVKAESRRQQLQVLRQWVEQRSILFLGYQQFAKIICDDDNIDAVSESCKRILLEKPTLLILDEGHTSRNKETNMLISLARVKTPRKVVLTGTLFQNNVEEVFNILNLVRPKFLKRPGTRDIVSRFKAEIPRGKQMNQNSIEGTFFAAVELTLKNSIDYGDKAKASLINDLREMTRNILHYHKADFRGVLLGLTEFTVMLNLSSVQRDEVKGLRRMDLFKQISLGAALYIHPKLKTFLEENPSNGDKGFADNNTLRKLDAMLKRINVGDGVKMKFFLNLLALCESAGEKPLVFSQYIIPIKALERLMSSMKGWRLGKEMFTITGDSSNEQRELSMERFNNSPDAKVLFGSIKACGEGISLVGASRVLILDVHLNPSVTQQAVARAYRPGQKRRVYAYRLIAADSPEEENYETCSRKEMMSKMWFEWKVGSRRDDFGFRAVDVDNSGDAFLETAKMREDIKSLFTR